MRVITCNEENKEQFYSLLKQLRESLNVDDFELIYKAAKAADQYELIGIEDNSELVALMGYRILFDYVHGKHFYIDDLVTSKESRSKGYGKILLTIAEEKAKELGCTNLRLCTGIENERGKNFYLKYGWNQRAVVFKKKI